MKQNKVACLNPVEREKYNKAFRRPVFHIVYEGYIRLNNNGKDYSTAMEEAISHDLTEEIENFLEDGLSPNWVEKFSVHREWPISPHGEVGRSRPRLDIRIRSGERPICPEFVFEAKRLRHDATESADYFGAEGIECFWNESGYPVSVFYEAGILGYIQDKDTAHWTDWLKKHFEKRRSTLHVCKDSGWDTVTPFDKLEHTFCTHHQPKSEEKAIVIFHVLLSFCRR